MTDNNILPPIESGYALAGPDDAKVLVDGQWVGVHTILTLRQSVIHTQRTTIESLNTRLTTLDALARAALAECEAWRAYDRFNPYKRSVVYAKARVVAWNKVVDALAATDAARKEAGL